MPWASDHVGRVALLALSLMLGGCFPGIEADPTSEQVPLPPDPGDNGGTILPPPECLLDTDCPQNTTDLCTARVRCNGNQCVLDPATAIECLDTGDPCQVASCQPSTGSCITEDVCVCEPRETPLVCGDSVTVSRFDSGSSYVLNDYPCVPGTDNSGPEHTFLFTPVVSEPVRLNITSGSVAGVYVLHNGGQGCDSNLCVAGGGGGVAFITTANVTYAVAIEHTVTADESSPVGFTLECGVVGETDCTNGLDDDANGLTDCADGLCLGVQGCPSQVETLCADEVDDDLDGLTDCEDLDCSQTGVCLEGCVPSLASPVLCGFSQELTTGGGSALATHYDCGFGEPDAPGKEVVYPFFVSEFKTVTASISAGPGAGLYVLQDTGKGCTPKDCIQYGLSQVQFFASPGVTYYLVVDSVLDASLTFAIDVSCL